jgi:hypothetical protein
MSAGTRAPGSTLATVLAIAVAGAVMLVAGLAIATVAASAAVAPVGVVEVLGQLSGAGP